MKAVRFRGLSIRILRSRWKVNILKGFMNLLVKSDPRDFNPQDEPEIECDIQKRIIDPCNAAASIKKARMVSAFTLVNKVSENQSLIEYRSDQVKKTKCADS